MCSIIQGCGLGLDVSVSIPSRNVRTSSLDQNAQRLGLISVSYLCVSDLVLVSTQNVSASRLGSRTISSRPDVSCLSTTSVTKDIRNIKSYRVFLGVEAPANTDHYLTVAKFAIQPQFKRRLNRTRRFDTEKLRYDPTVARTPTLSH